MGHLGAWALGKAVVTLAGFLGSMTSGAREATSWVQCISHAQVSAHETVTCAPPLWKAGG